MSGFERHVYRALALVDRSLESEEGMRAVQRQTGGTAPEIVQGLLDKIVALYAASGFVKGLTKDEVHALLVCADKELAELQERYEAGDLGILEEGDIASEIASLESARKKLEELAYTAPK